MHHAIASSNSWKHSLTALAAGLVLERAGTPELIAWAVAALEQGEDTPSLRRLAGCYAQDSFFDTLPWFRQSLREMGIELPEPDRLLSDYASLLAGRIQAGEQEALAGLREMIGLNYSRQQSDPLLGPLSDLLAAAELQADELGSYAWLYPEFATLPLAELIREECRLYLALRDQAVDELLTSSWCLSCGQREKALVQPRLQGWAQELWRRVCGNQAELRASCPHCGSEELLPLTRLAGRQKYLAAEQTAQTRSAQERSA